MSIPAIIMMFVVSAPVSLFVGPAAVVLGPGIVGSMTFMSARTMYGLSASPRP